VKEIKINSRKIGDKHPVFVIAEIGINHEGSYKKAKKMIKDAHDSGAECVKFQCHIIEDEMIPNDVIPANAKESIWDIMKRCSLSQKEEEKLKKYTEELNMIYLSTPFSRAAANRLEEMNIPAYKIGSGECNNYPLIKHIASFGKPIILSTGMNDISSIRKSVEILKNANVDYGLMHTTSMYPTPYDKVRLGALNDLKKYFPNIPIGLSDHSVGNYTSFASISLGASIIEKHFTSNKKWIGPDIQISIDPKELQELIIGCQAIKKSLGGKKNILKEEQPTINFAYACVVSIKNIKKGDKFSKENIWVKRPGTGEVKAKEFFKIIGKKSTQNILSDKQLNKSDIQ
jgi:sialic acid synthase SpsE|tara:strand:- start:369 stop:1400 length:1032 start_codon:yes stop_codon:yes gene_type:complete